MNHVHTSLADIYEAVDLLMLIFFLNINYSQQLTHPIPGHDIQFSNIFLPETRMLESSDVSV